MAGDERQAPDESWEASRRRREQALRDLAKRNTGGDAPDAARTPTPAMPPPPVISLAPRRSPSNALRSILIGLALLVVVGASVGGYVALHSRPQSRATATATMPPPAVLRPETLGIGCLQSMVWSPDGTHVAVLGYQHNFGGITTECPTIMSSPDSPDAGYLYWPGTVAIFDAAGKAAPQTLKLDDLVNATLHLPAPTYATAERKQQGGSGVEAQIINYAQMLWSADGSHLLISFSVPVLAAVDPQSPKTLSYVTRFVGLLATDLTGTNARVQSYADANSANVLGTWNLATGGFTPYPRSTQDIGLLQQVPPLALGYTWSENGDSATLIPDGALTTGAPPAAPPLTAIGAPTDAHISVWQPGTISLVSYSSPTDSQGVVIPGAYTYTSTLFAVSPDQRFATTTPLGGLLETGTPPPASILQQAGAEKVPVLPLRDNGLRAALAALTTAYTQAQATDPNGGNKSMDVTWTRDGKRLATLFTLEGQNAQGTTHTTSVTIYDCASGKVLASLAPAAAPNVVNSFADGFSWSPDGSHLFAYTANLAQITVWDLHTLK